MGWNKTRHIFLLLIIQFIWISPLQAFQEVPQQDNPLGFIEHKVERKETIFGICRLYGVTEKELKRYNPELYANELQRGMLLKVPKYSAGHNSDQNSEIAWTTYTIGEGDTRWSIAHRFGISLDSLESLNPDLPKHSVYLAIGDTLKLPPLTKLEQDTPKESKVNEYRIVAGQTLYSLARDLGVSQSDILSRNPQITDPNNLQEGLVIQVPEERKANNGQPSNEFAYYEVSPGQTQFSLTRLLGVTWDELLELNPHLERGLQAGMVVKIPSTNGAGYSVKNNLLFADVNLKDSINLEGKPSIAVMFPFRTDRLNLADEAQTLERIEQNNALRYSLGLYSGILIAMDSLADMGMSSEIRVFDTQLSSDRVRQFLDQEDWSSVQAVIGPLDSKLVAETAAHLDSLHVPVVAPMPLSTPISSGNLFGTYTNEDRLRSKMLQFMAGQVAGQKLFVIADRENKDISSRITGLFPQCKTVPLKQEDENIYINTTALKDMLQLEEENWFFLETDDFKIASSVASILNSLNSEETPIRLFTTYRGRAYDNEVISAVHLSNLRFTYPSPYRKATDPGFIKRYRKRFGGEPNRFAVRGFDLGMDVLLRLGYKSNLFEAADQLGATHYSGNAFNYLKEENAGYANVASYILMYDQLQIIEIENP